MLLKTLNITLADDDADDRFLFQEAIGEVKVQTKLEMFGNGQKLMDFLLLPENDLPHLIFLDLNMPVKNGMDCLREIRGTPRLQDLIVAIYSTSSSEKDIEDTFVQGANIYIKKPNSFSDLKRILDRVLRINWQYQTSDLNHENFLLRL